MFELWRGYVAEIGKATPQETFQLLRDRCLERCQRVAGASGGVLGFGKTSPAESKVIEAVAAAFVQ
jgi:hypothetical protein